MPYGLKALGWSGLLLLQTLSGQAAEIREGIVKDVAAGSVWFQERADLTAWQTKRHDSETHAADVFEAVLIERRRAWRFSKSISVKVKQFDLARSRIEVEMETEGRLRGSIWFLDARQLR